MARNIDAEMDAVLASQSKSTPNIDAEMDEVLGLGRPLGTEDFAVSHKQFVPKSEKETMANIEPLTPQQEFAIPDMESPEFKKASTLTPKEEQTASTGRKVVYPILGGTAGALVGHPVAGAVLGSQIADVTDIAKGNKTDESLLQQITEIGTGKIAPKDQYPILGQVVEQAFKAGSDALAFKAIDKVIKIAGPVVAKTILKPFTNKIEGLLEKFPDDNIVKQAWNLVKSEKPKVEKTFEVVGGKEEPLKVGEAATKGAVGKYEAKIKTYEALHGHAEAISPKNVGVDIKKTVKMAKDILDDPYELPEAKSVASKFMKMVEDSEAPTFEQAYKARQMLTELSKGGKKTSWDAYNFKKSLDDEIVATAKNIGREDIVKANQKAIGYWRDNVVPQGELADALGSKSPEKVIDYMTANVKNAKQMMETLPKDNAESLRRANLTRMWNKTEDKTAFFNELDSFTKNKKEVFEAMYTKDQQKVLRNLSDPSWFKKNPWAKTVVKGLFYQTPLSYLVGNKLGLW